MAGISYSSPETGASPAWVADELKQREAVVVSGAMLHAADFAANPEGRRFVESGTLVGRTFAERDAGRGFGPFAAGDNQVFLILHDVWNADEDAEITLYRNGRMVNERWLPAATKAAGPLAEVRARYQTRRGEA